MSVQPQEFPSTNPEGNRGLVAVILAVGTIVTGLCVAFFPVLLPVFTGLAGFTSAIVHSYFKQ